MLVKMCTVAKYQPGDLLDLSRGGVCFRGGYKELGNETTEAQKALQQIEEEQKKLDMKFKEYMQVSEAHNNLSYLASKKQIAKKQSIHELGLAAKSIGLNRIADSGENDTVSFIQPNKDKKNAHVAHCKENQSYVIIMHFGDIISKAIQNGIHEDIIDQAF